MSNHAQDDGAESAPLVLLTVEEMIEALKKADVASYRPPGG